ncbi:MAG: rhodanese-like domain-containing protein, partial [Terriglobales bacterium]
MSDPTNSTICQQITSADLAAATGEAVLLDVRSPIEFETEHIPDSINVPLDELDSRCEEVSRKGRLIVICRSGKRAERGAFTLMGRGFQPSVLEGGLLAWRKAGLPLKEGKKMLSIERQIQLIVGIGALSGALLGAFVNPWFLLIPGFFGAGLTFAGLTGTCGLAILLSKAPWNKLPT